MLRERLAATWAGRGSLVLLAGEPGIDKTRLAAGDPESARFRLFDAVSRFLRNASQAQTLLLLLDDLHWADKASLLLLQFLVRELGETRLLVLGTYRDTDLDRRHPLAEVLFEQYRAKLYLGQVRAREPVLRG
ncbi:MAG: AAA family ATPase [Dehalococcoidia bacterium]